MNRSSFISSLVTLLNKVTSEEMNEERQVTSDKMTRYKR